MYKQILIPDETNHSIILPEDLYGKKIEVTVVEVIEEEMISPKQGTKNFLDDIEAIPDFPGKKEIRESRNTSFQIKGNAKSDF